MKNSRRVGREGTGFAAPLGRRGVLWSGLLALAVLVGLTTSAGAAAACVCVKRTLCEKVQAADVVFEATPTDRTTIDGSVTYTVTPGTVYKGIVLPGTVVQPRFSTCGIDLRLGTPYIVFGTSTSPITVATNSCSGTAPEASFTAADIQQIKRCAATARTAKSPARLAARSSCTGT